MMKTLAVALGLALSLETAHAQEQPAPAPASAPAPQEKASGESLQPTTGSGDAARPWAAGVTPDKQQKAMELFREGNVNHNDGVFVKAAELYAEALKSWDHPAIHYNRALSLMNLDRPIEVEQELQKAVQYGVAPLSKDKYDHAKEYLVLIQQQLATVDIQCSKPGAKVSVDGKEVYTVGAKGEGGTYKNRVRIGKHTFVAEKPGYNAEIEAPFIGPGETFRIELKLYTAEELTRYRRRWQNTWFPYAVMGAGVAIAIGGGLLELSAKSSYNEFDDKVAACQGQPASSMCTANLGSIRDSGDTKKTLGYVAYGVAGATVVTGAVLLWLNRTEAYQITADEYRHEQRELQKKTSFVPIVGPGSAGAAVSGTF